MVVVRFDDISDPAHPKPLANLVNFPLHPEFLDGNDLITADYLGPLQRMVDRETEALTIFTQGSVGTAEPERSTYHSIHERLEFTHKEYAQAEYGGAADGRLDRGRVQGHRARRRVAVGRPGPLRRRSRTTSRWRWRTSGTPGRSRTPIPGVSNCRTDKTLEGDPQVPVVGPARLRAARSTTPLYDGAGRTRSRAANPGLNTDAFHAAGHPGARELLRAVLRGARGGPEHPPPGVPARGDPLHRLLLRAVEGPGDQHQDAHRQGGGQPVQRLRLGRAVHAQRRRHLRGRPRGLRHRHLGLPRPAQARRAARTALRREGAADAAPR